MIVLDLEMNKNEAIIRNNIIEIGAVFVDIRREKILDTFECLVNWGTPIHSEITELTGITDDMVSRGHTPEQAFKMFWDWVDGCRCGGQLMAWGSDVYILKEQSLAIGVPTSVKISNHNLKETSKLFRAALPNAKNKGGLVNTMNVFGLKFNGKPHRAAVDATNTARLAFKFKKMISNYIKLTNIMKDNL